jgi:putative sterol carrier protein
MADSTEELFESLRHHGHDPLLQRAKGTVRFDIRNGQVETWSVELDGGDLAVSRKARKADCTIKADKAVFDRIASGEVNALAAVLRGELEVLGDPELLLLFQRLLPGPSNGAHRNGAAA